jgi:hypothetical protein
VISPSREFNAAHSGAFRGRGKPRRPGRGNHGGIFWVLGVPTRDATGYLNRPSAIVVRPTQADDIHRNLRFGRLRFPCGSVEKPTDNTSATAALFPRSATPD